MDVVLAAMATTCLQWCVNVEYTTDFVVKQLGVLISIRRRTVVLP